MQGIGIWKKDLDLNKRSKGNFLRKNLKVSIVSEIITGSEDTLMHKEERPCIFSNSFTYCQTEQIKKGKCC